MSFILPNVLAGRRSYLRDMKEVTEKNTIERLRKLQTTVKTPTDTHIHIQRAAPLPLPGSLAKNEAKGSLPVYPGLGDFAQK